MTSKLVRLVYDNNQWKIEKEEEIVTPIPIGLPIILERYRNTDQREDCFGAHTFIRDYGFQRSLSEDLKLIAPKNADSYVLGEKRRFGSHGIHNMRIPIQFYKIKPKH